MFVGALKLLHAERWMRWTLSWHVMMGRCVVGIRRPMIKPLHWIRKILRSAERDVSWSCSLIFFMLSHAFASLRIPTAVPSWFSRWRKPRSHACCGSRKGSSIKRWQSGWGYYCALTATPLEPMFLRFILLSWNVWAQLPRNQQEAAHLGPMILQGQLKQDSANNCQEGIWIHVTLGISWSILLLPVTSHSLEVLSAWSKPFKKVRQAVHAPTGQSK